MIQVGTPGTKWTPPVVLGTARVTFRESSTEAGSAKCGVLDCWVYPLIGVVLGGAVGAVTGLLVARKIGG